MEVNEVVVNGVTELSLVNDTVSEDTLLEGTTAHDASGNQITGKVVVVPVDSELNAESENAIQNKAVAAALQNVDAKTVNGYTVGTDVPEGAKFTDTTYSAATTSANGLMIATDKAKLDNTNMAYGTCATAAATAAKVVTITGNTNWKLAVCSEIVVKFTNTNTASSCTLNVNGTGAKQIWYNNAVYTGNSNLVCGNANRYVRYMYDGTYWVWMGWSADVNTVNTAGATNTSSKIFLIGATSQAANPQTYSHDTCYVGTDGCLYSNGKKVLTASEGGATIYTGALTQATGTYTITLGVKPKFVLCYSNDEADSTRKWWAKSTSGGHPNITFTSTGFQYAQVVGQYFSQYFIALA